MAARRELREKLEIIGHLGSGGMAEVFLARQDSLERNVAVKELKAAFAENPELYERFLREARTGAGLTHENIVQVFHFGEGEQGPFIVLEYVEGADLKRAIKQAGAIPPRAAVIIFHAVAKALAYAHQRGLIHRDVKPGNIIIGKTGEVKLMDFGIVRDAESDLTRTGAFLGTPSYMAPEQFQGEKLTSAADIFSLGIVMYETLTGVKPFRADDEISLSKRIQTYREVAPRRLNPEIPWSLQRIVRRALKKKPAKRYRRTYDLVRAMEKLMNDQEKAESAAVLAEMLQAAGAYGGGDGTTVAVAGKKPFPDDAEPTPLPRETRAKIPAKGKGKKPVEPPPLKTVAPAKTKTSVPEKAAEVSAKRSLEEQEVGGLAGLLWKLALVLLLFFTAAGVFLFTGDFRQYLPEAIQVYLPPPPRPPETRP